MVAFTLFMNKKIKTISIEQNRDVQFYISDVANYGFAEVQ